MQFKDNSEQFLIFQSFLKQLLRILPIKIIIILLMKPSLSILIILVVCALSHLNHHSHPERQGVKLERPLYVKHPLHNVEDNVNSPVNVNAVIEISEGTNGKFELDQETGLLALDRILATPVVFATNYGFLPKSIGLDNDPLDVMVISSLKIPPLTIVNVRILGVMRMIDTGEVDDKLIGVPEKDPVYTSYKEITDIPSQTINKIKAFFETYKILDNKKVTVVAFEDKLQAYATIEDCQSRYKYIYGH